MKKKKQQPRIDPPLIQPGQYPFLNPIIVTKDHEIIDGQHRFEVCKLQGRKVLYIQLDYSKEELYTDECINQIVLIKEEQSKKLDAYFKKYKIGYKNKILLCSSDDKIKYFYTYRDKLKIDSEYWSLLRENYPLASNNFKFKKELHELFTSNRPGREYLMNESEREKLIKLPNEIKIYRGMSVIEEESKDWGISWSLNKTIAEVFAEKYLHNYDTRHIPHIVKEIIIPKSDVVAYFEERNEEEIIYLGK